MLTVFSYQVLRLLRDRILLVWTLGFPIVLSLIFMAQFSNLNEAYEANPMSFGVVQDEAYRTIRDWTPSSSGSPPTTPTPTSSPRSPTPPPRRPRPLRNGERPTATSPSRAESPCCT